MNGKIEEVLQKARKMELDGIEFYSKASGNASNEMAKRFFASLVEDEKRHFDIIEKVGKGMGVDVESLPYPADSIKTVFSEFDDKSISEIAATAEEKDAVATALEMEKKSYDLYAEAAANAADDQQAQLFSRLEQEENQHYEMLQNTSDYLNDNEKWFLNVEGALLTGDMSSLG